MGQLNRSTRKHTESDPVNAEFGVGAASEKPGEKVLTKRQVTEAVKQEREVLDRYNAVSAVTGGPVEDMEGVPLPGDVHQGFPPAASEKEEGSEGTQ